MSLVDRTNEEIPLSMEGPGKIVMVTDIDRDSSISPEPWVILGFSDDGGYHLTLEEAGLLHDRLGLILGRVSLERTDIHVPFGPAGIAPERADATYLRSAADRWRSGRLMGFNLTHTVAGILDTIADKLDPRS